MKKGFIKTCTVLKDYEDPTGTRTWVEIKRIDPARVGVGGNPSSSSDRLWKWNPTVISGNVTRKSKAEFGVNYVRLKQQQP